MALEFAADRAAAPASLEALVVANSVIDWQPTLASLLAALRQGADVPALAAGFHAALADAIVTVAERAGVRDVLLTGGCFQNRRLTEATTGRLRAAGFVPLRHHRVPPNDGGLAVGQALFAARPLVQETAPCASPFPARS